MYGYPDSERNVKILSLCHFLEKKMIPQKLSNQDFNIIYMKLRLRQIKEIFTERYIYLASTSNVKLLSLCHLLEKTMHLLETFPTCNNVTLHFQNTVFTFTDSPAVICLCTWWNSNRCRKLYLILPAHMKIMLFHYVFETNPRMKIFR